VVYGNKLLECHDAFLYYQFIMICGCESDPVSPDFELGLVPIPFFCPWIIRILLPILCSLDLFARQPRGASGFWCELIVSKFLISYFENIFSYVGWFLFLHVFHFLVNSTTIISYI
jgi:hypothetical protein